MNKRESHKEGSILGVGGDEKVEEAEEGKMLREERLSFAVGVEGGMTSEEFARWEERDGRESDRAGGMIMVLGTGGQ
jgi:16S rRNA U1498 N3-methylase RsmE